MRRTLRAACGARSLIFTTALLLLVSLITTMIVAGISSNSSPLLLLVAAQTTPSSKTFDCQSQASLTSGTYKDFVKITSSATNKACSTHSTITIRDIKLDGNIIIDVAKITTLVIRNVKFSGSNMKSDYGIYFQQSAYSGTSITIKDCTYTGATNYFVYFEGETQVTGTISITNNNVTQTGGSNAKFITFALGTGVGAIDVSRNRHIAPKSTASSFLNVEIRIDCASSLSVANCVKAGFRMHDNFLNYTCPSDDLSAGLIMYNYDNAYNLTFFEAFRNHIIFYSGSYSTNSIALMNVPTIKAGDPNRKYITINVSSNTIESYTEGEVVMIYFWEPATNVKLLLADNKITAKYRTGVTLVSFDWDNKFCSVELSKNDIQAVFLSASSLTETDVWMYMVFTYTASQDLNLLLSGNKVNASVAKSGRMDLLRTAADSGDATRVSVTIQDNDIHGHVIDNDLGRANFIRGSNTFIAPFTFKFLRNKFRITFTHPTQKPPAFDPVVGLLAADVASSSSSASSVTVVGNTVIVDASSSGIDKLLNKPLLMYGINFLANSNFFDALTFSNNKYFANVSASVRLIQLQNLPPVNKKSVVVQKNTVMCGYTSNSSSNRASSESESEPTCYGIAGIYMQQSSSTHKSSKATVFQLNNATVTDNTFDAVCPSSASSSSGVVQTSTASFPVAALHLRNATVAQVVVSGNTLKQHHCPEGAQAVRIEVWIDIKKSTTSFSYLPPTKAVVKGNSIWSNRCEPSCDFYAVFPFTGSTISNTTVVSGIAQSGAVLTLSNTQKSSVYVEENQIQLVNNDTASYNKKSVVSFVSLCRNCRQTSTSNLGVKMPGLFRLSANTAKCPADSSSSSSACSSSSQNSAVKYSYETIILRLPRASLGSQCTVSLIENTVHDGIRFRSSSSSSLPLPVSVVSSGANVDSAIVNWNCNHWSRGFQLGSFAEVCTGGAKKCNNVACFTRTQTLPTPTPVRTNTSSMTMSSTPTIIPPTRTRTVSVTRHRLSPTRSATMSDMHTPTTTMQLTATENETMSHEPSTTVSETATLNSTATISVTVPKTASRTGLPTDTASFTRTLLRTHSNTQPTPSLSDTRLKNTPTRQLTKSLSISLVPPPFVPVVSAAASITATAVTSASSVFALEPAAPILAVRALGVAIIAAECEKNDGVIFTKDLQPDLPLGFPQSLAPPLYIGLAVDGHRGWLRGAVVANILIVPCGIALVVFFLTSIVDSCEQSKKRQTARRKHHFVVKHRTDLYVKSRCFAILAVVMAIGMEGAAFAMVCLIGQKQPRASIKHDDEILMCFFCGMFPPLLLLYFGITRIRVMLANSSCEPAVLKWGDGQDKQHVISTAPANHWKFLSALFGDQTWVLHDQVTATVVSEAVVQEKSREEAEAAEKKQRELQDWCQRVFNRVLPLFGRFKGVCRLEGEDLRRAWMAARGEEHGSGGDNDDYHQAGDDDEDNSNLPGDLIGRGHHTSLSEMAAKSSRGGSRASWKDALDKVARFIAPYSYFIDLVLNALVGTIRGMVTINMITCSSGAGLSFLIVSLSTIYACALFPRLSLVRGGLDAGMHGLMLIGTLMMLAKSVAGSGFLTGIVITFGVCALLIAGTQFGLSYFKSLVVVPANGDENPQLYNYGDGSGGGGGDAGAGVGDDGDGGQYGVDTGVEMGTARGGGGGYQAAPTAIAASGGGDEIDLEIDLSELDNAVDDGEINLADEDLLGGGGGAPAHAAAAAADDINIEDALAALGGDDDDTSPPAAPVDYDNDQEQRTDKVNLLDALMHGGIDL